MNDTVSQSTILGIDMGPNSVGWALLECNDEKPCGVIDAGVRVFEAGLDDPEQDGRGVSRNVERRNKRQMRRQNERRTRRLAKLINALQRASLLPDGNAGTAQTRHLYLEALDRDLDSPYVLRARAIDEKVEPFELGRAIYHLAQRRGFLSNRRGGEDDKETGVVKKSIGELSEAIEETGSRTLGEYLANQLGDGAKVRCQYTSRQMLIDEFELIWKTQAGHHPDLLTDDHYKAIRHAIFHQRPLKTPKNLVGECQLVRGQKRAPWTLLAAQRFRILQSVNNLSITDTKTGEIRPLTDDERDKLITKLELSQNLTFPQIRKLLGLPRSTKFSLELGGEKSIPGNKTAARLAAILGEDVWKEMSDDDRNRLVEDLRSIANDDALKRRLTDHWGYTSEQAGDLARVKLETGYCAFSRRALGVLLPELEKGQALQTVIREKYPDRWENKGVGLDVLPPLDSDYMPDIRNPIVERSLTELRRVVNAVIKKYGKPSLIRIELGRDLKRPPKVREDAVKRMRRIQRDREAAAKKILTECKIEDPSRSDILKVLLAEECGWTCPYTGKHIEMAALVGAHPQFDIEHIVPYHRSLDNSFINLTLCDARENRDVKRGKTPYEAYHGTDKWDEILQRIAQFRSHTMKAKLHRFQVENADEFFSDFTARQLNDTRYASRLAKTYLGLLYADEKADGVDSQGKLRVQAISGPATALIRNGLELNGILGDGPGKSREDHRHHAVDAITVALTGPGMVKRIADAAGRASSSHRPHVIESLPEPWDGFKREVSDRILGIVTSHRVSRRVRGTLHRDTFYGTPETDEDGKAWVKIRKPVDSLSASDIEKIVDPAVRQAVSDQLKELGKSDPKQAFKDPADHPYRQSGHGEAVPIHRVRLRVPLNTFPVGDGPSARHVQSESNHHIEVIEVCDEKGKTVKWRGELVSMMEAYRRLSSGEPVVKRKVGKNECYLFSLAPGEMIELDSDEGRSIYRVRSVWAELTKRGPSARIAICPVNDARIEKDMKKAKVFMKKMLDPLRKLNCGKVTIDPIGRVRTARD